MGFLDLTVWRAGGGVDKKVTIPSAAMTQICPKDKGHKTEALTPVNEVGQGGALGAGRPN